MRTILDVDIWSDVVCPWCYIGKVRFERAVAEVADDIEVRWVFRPYQLDPRAPLGVTTPVIEAYAKKFGGPERARQIIDHLTAVAAAEGIELRMDRALRANTLLAHRLLWVAGATEHQHALKDRLLRAYFEDGLDVGDPDVLARCAGEVGMDESRARAFLDSDDGSEEVRASMAAAADHEITGVPTYVIGSPDSGPLWMVPGAQDSDVFVRVLRRAADRLAAAHQASGG